MAKKFFIPSKHGDLLLWLNNYKLKLTEHKATLGLTDTEYNLHISFCDALILALNANTQAHADSKQAGENLSTAKSTSLKSLLAKIANVKTLTPYTTGIGQDLKIIGPEQNIDENNSKPVLKIRKLEIGYELSFGLEGFFDGVKIFRQRVGEGKLFLATDTASPYIDTEPMVNGTKYTAWFMIGDDTVGLESDAITISI